MHIEPLVLFFEQSIQDTKDRSNIALKVLSIKHILNYRLPKISGQQDQSSFSSTVYEITPRSTSIPFFRGI
jgi:hypothetical protein